MGGVGAELVDMWAAEWEGGWEGGGGRRGQSWGIYGLLNWLPALISDQYHVDVQDLALFTVTPLPQLAASTNSDQRHVDVRDHS